MNERQPHSLKSDIVVGVGGLMLAAAASFSEIREAFFSNNSTGKLESNISSACFVDMGQETVQCLPFVSQECKDNLISAVQNPSYPGWLDIPSSCQKERVVIGFPSH